MEGPEARHDESLCSEQADRPDSRASSDGLFGELGC